MTMETLNRMPSCTSMPWISLGRNSGSFSLRSQTARMRRAEYFGCAFVTAEEESGFAPLIFARAQYKGAAATATSGLPRRPKVTGMPLAGRSARYTPRGLRCTPDAATRITTDSTVMAGAEYPFAVSGMHLMRFSPTWAVHGVRVYPSTASTTTGTMSPATVVGQTRRSRPQTVKRGAEVIDRRIDADASPNAQVVRLTALGGV